MTVADESNSAVAPRRRLRMERSSAGSRGGWNGGRGLSATARSSAIRAARDMKEILNAKIKRRESLPPVCALPSSTKPLPNGSRRTTPSVHDAGLPGPRGKTNADPRGYPCRRIRTSADRVRQTNPRYYRLIEAFRDLTGIPMVLNTSFNENEPVVCRPEEALDCFLRTRWICS